LWEKQRKNGKKDVHLGGKGPEETKRRKETENFLSNKARKRKKLMPSKALGDKPRGKKETAVLGRNST